LPVLLGELAVDGGLRVDDRMEDAELAAQNPQRSRAFTDTLCALRAFAETVS
jgi:hypothetical protein